MGRLNDLRKLKDAAAAKLTDESLRPNLAKTAGDVVGAAAAVIEGAEAVAERSGLTNKGGDISKIKLAKAALRPAATAKRVLQATADEVQARREMNRDQG